MGKRKQKMLKQIDRGRERSKQKEDERKRKKADGLANMKPGARRAIVEGLMARDNPIGVAKKEYSRRKYEREQKSNGKSKESSDKTRSEKR